MRKYPFRLALFCLAAISLLPLLKYGSNERFIEDATDGRTRLVKPDAAVEARIIETYGRLPLSFEANFGQTDKEVKFLSRGNGYNLFLTPTEAVLQLRRTKEINREDREESQRSQSDYYLRMRLVGANAAPQVDGINELPGKSNYFIGNDPKNWRTDVPHYSKVRYKNVYPGVDVVYYGNQRRLEYDFILQPGTSRESIALKFQGASKIELDANGDLILQTEGGELKQHKPIAYQETNGVRKTVEAGYLIKSENEIGFQVGDYDESKTLVIDPVLSYSTYLGGSNYEQGRGISLDSSGNIYMAGLTGSTNFPTASPLQASNGGGQDALVTKLNPAGSALIYSTYLGGSGGDGCFEIAVDSAGSAYVTGPTDSANFPTTPGAFQPAKAGGVDTFATKLNAAGNALAYSTYIGGSGLDQSFGIAVDSAGNAYVSGQAGSANFPTTTGAFQTTFAGGNNDAFVTKLNPTGSALVYSTFLGGSGDDAGSSSRIAVDSGGNAYVTGDTRSSNFPTTPGAFQTTFGGGTLDAFVTKLNPAGSALVYSTFLGGSSDDASTDIAIDTSGNAYVTGNTDSANYPTVSPFQAANGGGSDAFVTKLNAAGNALVYSTYLGGSGSDPVQGIALDSFSNAYVTGFTDSANYPTVSPFQAANGGGLDAFVTKLNATGNALVYSTYLGGSGVDASDDVAIDSAGNAFVTGNTSSTNFPTMNPFQAGYGGGSSDAFIAKIGDAPICPTITLSPPTLPGGTAGMAYSETITASGGSSPYTFSVTSGALPDGLTLSLNGILSGIPTMAGTFNFEATAFDANGCMGNQSYQIQIAPPLISSDFFLHASGSVLFLNNIAPTAAAAQFKDSASINFNGGNPWKEIGVWASVPGSIPSGVASLINLSDLHVWLGLKNSDDQGTRFDLRAEILKNGVVVASGETFCITGVTRNPNLAKEVTVLFGSISDGAISSTDELSVRVLTRIGTDGAGGFCGGHSNAVGLRLYFDSVNRSARFGATFQ